MNEINKKLISQEKFSKEREIKQEIRKNFIINRNKLSDEERQKLDEEFFNILNENNLIDKAKELYCKGASISFLKEGHVFDNFSTFIRKDRYNDDLIRKYKIYIDSSIEIQDLSAQVADYTEGETFFQILLRQIFLKMWPRETMIKGSFQLFYETSLNFEISLGVKDLIETQYYNIFGKFENNYDPKYQEINYVNNTYDILNYEFEQEAAKERFFELVNPKENRQDFNYQLKFIELIVDNLERLEESPNKKRPELNISEHYNILFTTWENLTDFYKTKFMNTYEIKNEKDYYYIIEDEIQSFEKSIKILIELVPIYYKYKKPFLRDLLDKLFLKYKGLVFKNLENEIFIEEKIKDFSRNYLFKKYLSINLTADKDNLFNFIKINYEKLIVKSDFYLNLEKQYFEDINGMKLLYSCLITFYLKKNRKDIIEKIFKFENENNLKIFNNLDLINPLTEEKLLINKSN